MSYHFITEYAGYPYVIRNIETNEEIEVKIVQIDRIGMLENQKRIFSIQVVEK